MHAPGDGRESAAALRTALDAPRHAEARRIVAGVVDDREARDEVFEVLAAAGRDGDAVAAELLVELVDRSGLAARPHGASSSTRAPSRRSPRTPWSSSRPGCTGSAVTRGSRPGCTASRGTVRSITSAPGATTRRPSRNDPLGASARSSPHVRRSTSCSPACRTTTGTP